ncbi:MAG TPA: PP2C family protein-serine/threonine phosphatase [Candidatus Limnocylindrales bacterium]|jgi:serine phosphatase RsbU (regulator of sigma subunit)
MTAARTGVPSAVPDLRRLIDDPRSGPSVANLLESAAALLPDVRVALTSPTASELLARGAEWRAGVPSVTRPIHHGATGAGFVAICGEVAPGAREAVARLVASAVEVALAGMAGADAPTPDEQVAREQAAHRLEGELAIGRRIQRSLMPRRFPAIDGWEIAAAYDAAREVGGDLYDAFPLRDRPGCLGIVVADVTGKGIPAALVMADVRALIHAAADHGGGPALTLSRVNKILVTERETGLFVTVAHGLIDTATGGVTLASAGHEPLHVLHPGGSIDVLELPGRLVGMVEDIQATETRLDIAPGDALVVHTDGVTEAREPSGQFYGEDRYRATLAAAAGRAAGEIVDAVVADVEAFRNGAEASDDLTLLVVRRSPIGVRRRRRAPTLVDRGGDDDVRVDITSG